MEIGRKYYVYVDSKSYMLLSFEGVFTGYMLRAEKSYIQLDSGDELNYIDETRILAFSEVKNDVNEIVS